MNRPETPIPNGCSITLFACHVNFGDNSKDNNIKRIKSDHKLSIYDKPQNKKNSLKHSRSPKISLRQTWDTRRVFEIDSVNKQKNQQNLSQISSVLGPRYQKQAYFAESVRKPTNIYNKRNSNERPQRPSQTSRVDNKQNLSSLQIYNGTTTNFFTDQITLNQMNSFCKKQRQTANTDYFSRRVQTQEARLKQNVMFFNQMSNRKIHSNMVYRSELIQPHHQNNFSQNMQSHRFNNTNSLQIFHPVQMAINSSNFSNSQNILRSSDNLRLKSPSIIIANPYVIAAQNQIMSPQRSPALKKSTYIEGKPAVRVQQLQQISDKKSSIILNQNNFMKIHNQAPKQQLKDVKQSVFTSLLDSNQAHMRKISSPRVPKKFNTLIDLNCKNIESSHGQKTSSNHISILASQQTLKNSHIQQNNDEFTKIIKLMTLKSMPLNSQIWENHISQSKLQQNFK